MNPTIDKSSSVDSVAPEIKLRCESPDFHPGGGGINVSRAIKKLGGVSLTVYTSGGSMGQMLENLLIQEGIQHQPVAVSGLTRESFTVFEKSTTLQYRFSMPGPEITTDECQQVLDTVFSHDADYLVASGSLPPGVPDDFYAQVAQQAKASNIPLIVDTTGNASHEAAKAGVFLLKPNLRELEIFVQKPIESDDHLKVVAQELIAAGMAEVLAVSMGAAGAAFITADTYANLRAPMVPIQSKVGAGDSMVGGIVLALARGQSLLDAVRYGVAAGSAAVMTPGTELCRLKDTDMLFEKVTVS